MDTFRDTLIDINISTAYLRDSIWPYSNEVTHIFTKFDPAGTTDQTSTSIWPPGGRMGFNEIFSLTF